MAPAVMLGIGAPCSHGASIVLAPPPGWNGFFIQATVEAGFKEHGGIGSAVASSATSKLVVDYAEGAPVAAGHEFWSEPISISVIPSMLGTGSGGPKDISSGAMIFSYKVGSLAVGSEDRLTFNLSGTTSAVDAYFDFGAGLVPADSYFRASLSILCYGPIHGDYAAAFGLPAMPSLHDPEQESISASASIEGGAVSPLVLASQTDGSAAVMVPLDMADFSEFFKYEMVYAIRTPFGTDPDFSYDFTGTASVVPECGIEILSCLGFVAAAATRRHRQ